MAPIVVAELAPPVAALITVRPSSRTSRPSSRASGGTRRLSACTPRCSSCSSPTATAALTPSMSWTCAPRPMPSPARSAPSSCCRLPPRSGDCSGCSGSRTKTRRSLRPERIFVSCFRVCARLRRSLLTRTRYQIACSYRPRACAPPKNDRRTYRPFASSERRVPDESTRRAYLCADHPAKSTTHARLPQMPKIGVLVAAEVRRPRCPRSARGHRRRRLRLYTAAAPRNTLPRGGV